MSKISKHKTSKSFKNSEIIKLSIAIVLTVCLCGICMIPNMHHAIGNSISKFISGITGCGNSSLETLRSNFWANILLLLLTIPVQFVCGFRFIVGTFQALKKRSANMSVLVFVGTTIAFLMSLYINFEPFIINVWSNDLSAYTNNGMPFYETCCMLVTFIFLGQILENYAQGKTTDAINELIDLVPVYSYKVDVDDNEGVVFNIVSEWICSNDDITVLDTKLNLSGSSIRKISVSDIDVGDFCVVEGNTSIPVDGEVVVGTSLVDQSMITGESDFVEMQNGSFVTGGTVNVKGTILIRVTKNIDDSVITKIIEAVKASQQSKAPVARVADKVASVFIPGILLCALLSFVGWMIYGFISNGCQFNSYVITHALMCGVSVSVVSCACALGLATPTAIAVAMGKGAGLGIIIKDGEVLETLCKVGYMVFDKTGTLTQNSINKFSQAGKTLRPEAEETLNCLRNDFDIETFMVSGDKQDEALRVGHKLGFEDANIRFETLPIDKKTFVENLKAKIDSGLIRENTNQSKKITKVAFVGDGINDAPALTTADIGITFESGTDIALSSGNVVLMHNNLYDIPVAIKLSKLTMRKIKQNLFWALCYNVIMIPLAALGILLPALAAFCHAISSILVIINSLTIKRFK